MHLLEMFNATHQVELPGDKFARQPMSLASSIHGYASNIDNLGALTDVVETIAQKHVSLHVLPEQYAVVKENLFWAMGQVLKDALTPQLAKAWGEAYDLLAYILIERERTLREAKANAVGGWEGYREFKAIEKKEESPLITSFVMKPADGGPLLDYKPGSYVAVRVEDQHGVRAVRNYSLSAPPGHGTYRISVTRVPPIADGAPDGEISSLLHENVGVGDTLHVGVPCGDFVLDVNHTKPIVLLSGGVGVTPFLSMFEFLAEKKVPNKVTMVMAWKTEQYSAFRSEVETVTKGNANLEVAELFFGEKPPSDEELKQHMSSKIHDRDAHFYFCGPPMFMQKVQQVLLDWQVPKDQMHFEFFGPTGAL